MTTIAIAGNPNGGKSSIFNLLTDGRQKVGNWPGVTVDKKIGKMKFSGVEADLVDLPGIYALSAWSEDERIARDYLVSCEADFLINVVDSTNLERNLFLTFLLKDMGIPMIVVLNQIDVAEKQGIKIDAQEIEKELGVPVITASAKRRADKGRILEKVSKAMEKTHEKAQFKLPPEDLGEFEILAENIYKQIEGMVARTVKKGIYVYTASDKLDKIVTNRYAGFPIFLLAMYLLFWLTIHVSGVFVDIFDKVFGAIFVDGLRMVLEKIGSPEIITVILADGVGVGIQTLSTFLPIIFTLFFFIAILEGSGYMSRGAFVMDRLMRFIGLPGKAFMPLLIGFGCSVPAIMATRALENKRDRILSVFMIPFMSCGARLPVYIMFSTVFFPDNGTDIVFALYITGMVLAVLTGLVLKITVYKGTVAPFIMELPQYRGISIKNAALSALFRLQAFIKKGVRILVPIIAILGVLNSVGFLEAAGKMVTPVLEPIGIERENWPASVALFSGMFAKEVIAGSLESLYSQNEAQKGEAQGLREAFHNNKASAFAFLLFVLLYMPCIAAVSVSVKEIGLGLGVLQIVYSTVLAWSVAAIFYQCSQRLM
jgi:ferrous iron transport protein B